MSAAGIFSVYGRGGSRKFDYKRIPKPFQNIFMYYLRVVDVYIET
jgi:hypothetical protein